MCIFSGCDKLWQQGTTLDDLRCPCGYHYWTLFQDLYVDSRDREIDSKGRALPMKEREAEVKKRIGPKRLEASIRVHFITHCISCGVKRRIYDGQQNVGFDEENLIRGFAEILEITQGDYTSRGTSGTLQAAQTSLPLRPRATSDVRSQPTSRGPQQIRLADPIADLRQSTRSRRPSSTDEVFDSATLQEETAQTRLQPRLERARTSSDSQRSTQRTYSPALETYPKARTDVRATDIKRSSEATREDRTSRHVASIGGDPPRHSKSRSEEISDDSRIPPRTLAPILQKLVAFGNDQYDSIASFLNSNSEIWRIDANDLQPEILTCLRRGDEKQAYRLVQRLLMLKGGTSREDRIRWIVRLGRSNADRDEFEEKIELVLERMKAEARQK